MIDKLITKCPYCGEDVISYWSEIGCISNPEYVLIADWVFHTICWDKQVEENPPLIGEYF